MNKKGVFTLEFTISLVLTVLVLIILGGFLLKAYSSQQCPVGYNIINDFSDPTIYELCGSAEKLQENKQRCCQRKSDLNEVCLWDMEDKEYLRCDKISLFNFNNVCLDNTKCGVSSRECSGAYCEKGVCLVENGIGRCVEKFNIGEKRINIESNALCIEGVRDNILGSKCEGEKGLHCIFDIKNSRALCRGGGFLAISEQDAFNECGGLCEEAKERFTPSEMFKSEFCRRGAIPVSSGGKDKPIMKKCSEIYPDCKCGVSSPEE